jgi:microcystin-dependent protein
MATVTTGYTFVNNETVTPARLNSLAGGASVSNIVDADVAAGAGIADTKLGTIQTAGKVSNSATTATNANTASAIVARDASGNFSAGTITSTAFIGDGTGITGLVPSGAILPFAMNTAPTGWLAADGSAVSRTTYAALWTALGTTSSPYGQGNGSTTFNLPDLRGYFVRGSGTNSDGTAAGTFGTKQSDDFKSHNHTDAGHTHTATTTAALAGTSNVSASGSANKQPVGTGAVTVNTGYADIQYSGGTETRPKNIAMLYCIKT